MVSEFFLPKASILHVGLVLSTWTAKLYWQALVLPILSLTSQFTFLYSAWSVCVSVLSGVAQPDPTSLLQP